MNILHVINIFTRLICYFIIRLLYLIKTTVYPNKAGNTEFKYFLVILYSEIKKIVYKEI